MLIVSLFGSANDTQKKQDLHRQRIEPVILKRPALPMI
jgi:hypothetical protein